MKVLVTQSFLTLCNTWTVACQAPLSMGFFNQEYYTTVGCHSLLQGIFPTQELNSDLLHCRWILYHLNLIWNARLDESQAETKISKRNSNNLRYVDDATLMADSLEELKSLLMKIKEESEKTDLKLNIQKTQIMASGSITSWQIDGGKWKQWQTIFLCSKITEDEDSSHEIKSCLLHGTTAMTNLDSILKGRDITLPTKVCSSNSLATWCDEPTYW